MVREMTAILPRPVAITRPSQLEVGAFYQIVGSTFHPDAERSRLDDRTMIPYQMVQVTGPPWQDHFLGDLQVPCRLWIDADTLGKHYFPDHVLPLSDVNVPEHGLHDKHLERIPDEFVKAAGVLREANRQQSYAEIVGW